MKNWIRYLFLFSLCLFGVSAFGQVVRSCPGEQPCSITKSGGTLKINNAYGGMNGSFEESFTGSPSTVSVTIQGCMRGGTCDSAADTNTSTAASIRGVTFTKPYSYFLVTASWTGGTSVTAYINPLITTAKIGGVTSGTTGQPAVYTSGSAIGSSAAWLDATAFAGATVDVKLNACITAVATAGGGTCDARALGGNQTIAGPINLGDVGGDAITVLLPPQGNWNCTIADGVSACMTQYPNTVVISQTPAGSPGLYVFNQVGTANPSYNYTTSLGAGGYLVLKGVKFRTLSTGHATANNIGFFVTGTFDFTTFDSVNVTDEKDANAVVFQNACCETVLSNFEVSGNNAAGVQPLLFSTSSDTNFGLVARGLIVNGPGATQPNIKCSDTNFHQSSIDITDLYEESSTTDLTTAINQVDGCAGFVIRGGHIKVRVGSSTAALLSQTNSGNGKVILDGVKVLENLAEAKMLAFANSNGRSCPVATCNVFTDDKGWIGRIETQQYCKSSAGTCASAQRGAVSIAAAASSVVVNTTDAPNDTSAITVTFDTTLGTALSVTCNTTAQQPYISAVTAGTSFTISTPATFTSNPGCFTFSIKK